LSVLERLAAIPRGLLGMLALVWAVESGLGRDASCFTTGVEMSWRYAAKAAQREARDCDILCFGDSAVKFGVVPRVIEARTGRKAYNLALYGGPPLASAVLLRHALANGARPTAVLVDFMPHLLGQGPYEHPLRWPLVADWPDLIELGWTARDSDLLARVLASRLLASYRFRHDVRANLLAALEGKENHVHWALPILWRNWVVNRGAQVTQRRPRHAEPPLVADKALYPDSWQLDPVSESYFWRFLDLAASRKIRVYWLVPPYSPEVYAHRHALGLEAPYNEFIRRAQVRYPDLVVIDARHAEYDPAAFVDPVHLDRHGAEIYSRDLAAILATDRARPPGPRLVALPPYRERPDGMAIEDINDSRIVLQSRPGSRR
jgi:hypothetical protein